MVSVVKSWNVNREYAEDILNNLVAIQNPTGHSLEHHVLTDPSLHSQAGLDDDQSCLPTSAALLDCQNHNHPCNHHDNCSV